jgi:hypothetical protein
MSKPKKEHESLFAWNILMAVSFFIVASVEEVFNLESFPKDMYQSYFWYALGFILVNAILYFLQKRRRNRRRQNR